MLPSKDEMMTQFLTQMSDLSSQRVSPEDIKLYKGRPVLSFEDINFRRSVVQNLGRDAGAIALETQAEEDFEFKWKNGKSMVHIFAVQQC